MGSSRTLRGVITIALTATLAVGAAGIAEASPHPAANVTTLDVGATGDAVTKLQQQLIASGAWLAGGVDGIYGPGTQRAVRTYQQANKLTVTGTVDEATAAHLERWYPNAAAPTTPATTPSTTPATTNPPVSNGVTTTPANFVGLRVGSKGPNVTAFQQALIAAGISVYGGADGNFGTYTARAMNVLQNKASIATTTQVDTATVNALSAQSGSKPTSTPALSATGPWPKLGQRGPDVVALQNAMIAVGLRFAGGADGLLGVATANALRAYQSTRGLPATGVADAATVNALLTNQPQTAVTTNSYARHGERGSRVAALQTALIAGGVNLFGGADGVFGAATTNAVMVAQRNAGLPVTGVVDTATATHLKLGVQDAPKPVVPPASVALDVNPVDGNCWYGDTWGAPRGGGRIHEGVDVIAAKGTNLRAVVAGTVTTVYTERAGSLTGNGLKLTGADGTAYFYAHLDTLDPAVVVGAPISSGAVVGTVGSTGNSSTPHLHFEIRPAGSAPINPYPYFKTAKFCGR